jgi:hypothetical protein
MQAHGVCDHAVKIEKHSTVFFDVNAAGGRHQPQVGSWRIITVALPGKKMEKKTVISATPATPSWGRGNRHPRLPTKRTMKVNILTESLKYIVLDIKGHLLDIGILLMFFVFFRSGLPCFSLNKWLSNKFLPPNRKVMDNAYEICTRWLSETMMLKDVETREIEAGRVLLSTPDNKSGYAS